MHKAAEYFQTVRLLLENAYEANKGAIEICADRMAQALAEDRNIFLFGTGHSHMLAEELFYRAGGLVKLQPVLEEALMLHESASKSTQMERLPGYAEILFEQYAMKKDDVILIISNSGRNGVCVDMAELAAGRGLFVIALTSLQHTKSGESRHKSGKKLYEFADAVLDNMGCIGDACVVVAGLPQKVSPTSTVVGAAILNAIAAQTVQNLVSRGVVPEVFSSSNVDGGDEINGKYIEKYKGVVKSL